MHRYNVEPFFKELARDPIYVDEDGAERGRWLPPACKNARKNRIIYRFVTDPRVPVGTWPVSEALLRAFLRDRPTFWLD